MTKENTVTLTRWISRGDEDIKTVTITDEVKQAGTLRGLRLVNVMNMDVDSISTLLTRCTSPRLKLKEISEMETSDFVELCEVLTPFLAPKEPGTKSETETESEYQRNQIFLSASRRQAHQFRGFIQKIAEEVDVELKGGDKILLSNGAELHFLGTSAATAQSYTGNLFFDEFFWVGNFANLRKVAGAMATLKGLTRTYFSTPSSESHEAYPFWTGKRWNEKRAKPSRVDFDTSWKTLNSGLLCPDKTWRQIVTLKDVIDHGWEFTDLEEIQDENTPDEYTNLYMCEFVREGEAVFSLNQLLTCGADGYDDWQDWKPYAPRPLGDREVWIGYDANGGSGNGDSGAVSVVAPPLVSGGKFRTIETRQLRGMEFEEQAKVIEDLTIKYNVRHIAIDGTGIGEAVWQLVKKFFPAAVCFIMSLSSKRTLVLKMQQVIRAGRWEYDRSEQALVSAFNAVRKITTPGGMVTYDTDRARGVSHGDLAWANMLAVINEPLGRENGSGGGSVREF